MPNQGLPLDIVGNIIQYLPYADGFKTVTTLCPGVEYESANRIAYGRRNPAIFFHDIVREVPDFIDLLRITKIQLIGIRAFSFFHHVNIKTEHPWHFMSPRGAIHWIAFIDHLESCGVEWSEIESCKRQFAMGGEAHCLSSINGSLISHGRIIHINLVWHNIDRQQFSRCITEFGMTPLQCIVSGHEAIDPYGKLHSQKKYRLWQEDSTGQQRSMYPNVFEGINFCHESFMEPISHDTHREYNPYKRFKRFMRLFADESESMSTKFNRDHLIGKGPQYMVQRTISSMALIEDAYQVSADNFTIAVPPELSYESLMSKYRNIEFPHLSRQQRYYDSETPIEERVCPSWIEDRTWTSIMSMVFDDNDDLESLL